MSAEQSFFSESATFLTMALATCPRAFQPSGGEIVRQLRIHLKREWWNYVTNERVLCA
jgi:hypothetical protein